MKIVHIANGDAAGDLLRKSGLTGEVLAWRDLLYDGPRAAGWPDAETLKARASFLQETTGGGVKFHELLENLEQQYAGLEKVEGADEVVLWFDACLHDQSVLCHILACMSEKGAGRTAHSSVSTVSRELIGSSAWGSFFPNSSLPCIRGAGPSPVSSSALLRK